MTIKQMFSAILSVSFMTTTGLVIGSPITPEEANVILKRHLSIIKKMCDSTESKLDLEKTKKHLESVIQFERKLAQLKFHKFMNQIHINDYR